MLFFPPANIPQKSIHNYKNKVAFAVLLDENIGKTSVNLLWAGKNAHIGKMLLSSTCSRK
jgi:hypothetical protein